ncbi:HnRNP-L/PTB/hephaestus splicing factor family protein [Aphelenchoides bicaudatus]|nr:HnRNP-L/PTB/hephaestus splicing factor family protein [Aphelenchoides bicaudatus]
MCQVENGFKLFCLADRCSYRITGKKTDQLKEHLKSHKDAYKEYRDAKKAKIASRRVTEDLPRVKLERNGNFDDEYEPKYSEQLARIKREPVTEGQLADSSDPNNQKTNGLRRVKPEPVDNSSFNNAAANQIDNQEELVQQEPQNEVQLDDSDESTDESSESTELNLVDETQHALELELCLFMSAGKIGINGLKYPPFKRLLTYLRPEFKVPSTSFSLDSCLDTEYNEVHSKMMEVLAVVEKFSLFISAVPLRHEEDLCALCISIGFKLNKQFKQMLLAVCEFNPSVPTACFDLQPILDETFNKYGLRTNQVINTILNGFQELNIVQDQVLVPFPHMHQKQILDILGVDIYEFVSWTQNLPTMNRNAIIRLNEHFKYCTVPIELPIGNKETNNEINLEPAVSPKSHEGFQPGRRHSSKNRESRSKDEFKKNRRSMSRSMSPFVRRKRSRSRSRNRNRSSSPKSKIPRRILENFKTPVITLCQVDMERFNCDLMFNLLSSFGGNPIHIKFLEARRDTCMVEFQRVPHANIVFEYMKRLTIFNQRVTIKPSSSKYISHKSKFSFKLPNGETSAKEYPRIHPFPPIKEDIWYPSKMLHFENIPPEFKLGELTMQKHVPNAEMPERIGQCKVDDLTQVQGFMEFKNTEKAAEAIAYFNNLHFRSRYCMQLRFAEKRPDSNIVWMQT